MSIITIKSEEDSQLALTLRGLLDAAVRAQGMQVADVALRIDHMIVEAGREWEMAQINSKTG